MPPLLHDEFVKQQAQCQAAGTAFDELDARCSDDDDEVVLAYGADPFDIIAALEEEHGCPILRM